LARFTGLLGLIVFIGLAYALSTNRRAIRWRTVAWGLGLQLVFAFLVIKWNTGQVILSSISGVITGLLGHSADGSSLVFGRLGTPGDSLATLAFAVLPTIIFVSAFFAILYHIGLMQQIIKVVAFVMQRTMAPPEPNPPTSPPASSWARPKPLSPSAPSSPEPPAASSWSS